MYFFYFERKSIFTVRSDQYMSVSSKTFRLSKGTEDI